MLPVVVEISQIPPVVVLGTLTLPVVDDALKCLADLSEPVTVPVVDLALMFSASHLSK